MSRLPAATWTPPFLPALTVSFTLGILVAAGFNLPLPLLVALTAAAFAAALILFILQKPAVAALFSLFFSLGMLSAQLAVFTLSAPLEPLWGRAGTFTGYVTEVLPATEERSSFLFFVEEVQLPSQAKLPVRTQVRVNLYTPPAGFVPEYGQPLQLQGKISEPRGQRNPGGFNFARYLAAQGAGGVLTVLPGGITVLPGQKGNALLAFLHQTRRRATTVFTRHLPAAEAGLLAGMVLGRRELVDDETTDAYRQLGLAHLLAVSGLHVGYVTAFASSLSALLVRRRRSRLAFFLMLFFLAFYVFLTGGRPPVWRAALMLLIVTVARRAGRSGDGLQALCLSCLALLYFRPLWLFSLSFQFSFAATAGILLLTPRLQTLLHRLPQNLASSLAVTLAAQAAVLPLQVNHFGIVSLLTVPLNLFCIPLTGVVMMLGLAGMFCGFASIAAAAPFCWAALPLLTILDRLPRALAGITSTALFLTPLSPVWWLVYLVCLAAFRQGVRLRPLTGKKILAFLLAANLLLFSGLPAAFDRSLEATFLDVGEGLAIHLRTPSGQHILIDAGTEQAGETVVVPFLRARGVKNIDLMLLTHPHDDHYGGMIPVLKNFRVAAFAASGLAEETASYAALTKMLTEWQIPCYTLKRGGVLALGELEIRALWPPASFLRQTGDDVNNNSLVLLVNYGNFSCLFTGDLEEDGLQKLLAAPGVKLKAQVVQIPHHGSQNRHLASLLQAAAPRLVVISVGPNPYGHPHPDVLAAIAASGCSLYRTDRHGAVTVTSDGRTLTHAGFLQAAEAGGR